MSSQQHQSQKQNHLINEGSPYLLQHAHNPVDWYPWGEEAFALAKREDKPIFLSIGYSTCHWCHVMAHESFEDSAIAAMMNDAFISIKVDREERPDIDNVYMKVCQMMTGSGGWPLTIIMTPDKEPFFAGTYIPPASRGGRMGMPALIEAVDKAWKNDRESLVKSGSEITAALSNKKAAGEKIMDTKALAKKAFESLEKSFDEQYGGFGNAPKFPSPHNLMFLLRYGFYHRDEKAHSMVNLTLAKMRFGGIYDQIGYGFHRYSTDRMWKTPHFEKMLYDQAMLILAYTEAYQNLQNDDPLRKLFKQTVDETITYVLRDMTSPEGGFYSAEDADSEGEEGKFYIWSRDELEENLTKNEFALVRDYFEISREGNYREEASHGETFKNILHAEESMDSFLRSKNRENIDWVIIRDKLFKVREKRIRPGLDDKILTDWNGLMIAALAKAGSVFQREKWLLAAEKATKFIKMEMTNDGELLHRYRGKSAAIPGFLDDYAFFAWGLTELYLSSLKVAYLEDAVRLTDEMNDLFMDKSSGGYFFSGGKNEKLISETKELYDGAIPSGNSVAAYNLYRLYLLTGDPKYNEIYVTMHSAFGQQVALHPRGYSSFLSALMLSDNPTAELVVIAPESRSKAILKELQAQYQPNLIWLWKETDGNTRLDRIAPFTKSQIAMGTEQTFYLCVDHACQLPTEKLNEVLNNLRQLVPNKRIKGGRR